MHLPGRTDWEILLTAIKSHVCVVYVTHDKFLNGEKRALAHSSCVRELAQGSWIDDSRLSPQTVPQLVACCNFMLLHNMGQSIHHQVRYLKSTPIVKTMRTPLQLTCFTANQRVKLYSRSASVIYRASPTLHHLFLAICVHPLLLFLLRQSGSSLKGTAARLSQTRPNTCGHLTSLCGRKMRVL